MLQLKSEHGRSRYLLEFRCQWITIDERQQWTMVSQAAIELWVDRYLLE